MKIKPSLRLSHTEKDGRHNIKITIGHKRAASYINTPFSVFPSEWRDGIVINLQIAERTNKFVAAFCDKCREVAYNLPFVNMSAKEVRATVSERVAPLVKEKIESLITVENE